MQTADLSWGSSMGGFRMVFLPARSSWGSWEFGIIINWLKYKPSGSMKIIGWFFFISKIWIDWWIVKNRPRTKTLSLSRNYYSELFKILQSYTKQVVVYFIFVHVYFQFWLNSLCSVAEERNAFYSSGDNTGMFYFPAFLNINASRLSPFFLNHEGNTIRFRVLSQA